MRRLPKPTRSLAQPQQRYLDDGTLKGVVVVDAVATE